MAMNEKEMQKLRVELMYNYTTKYNDNKFWDRYLLNTETELGQLFLEKYYQYFRDNNDFIEEDPFNTRDDDYAKIVIVREIIKQLTIKLNSKIFN